MHVVVFKNGTVFKSVTFEEEVIGIGSDADRALHLPDGRIAPHQADLHLRDGSWYVEPLSLDHALILNAHVVDEPAKLRNGDEIHLGDFELRVYIDRPDDAPPPKTAMSEELARIRQHPLPHGSLIGKEENVTLSPTAKERCADFALPLAHCTDFAKLLDVTAVNLFEAFEARMVWIGLRRREYGDLEFIEGRLKDGHPIPEPPHAETFRYRCLERNQFLVVPRTRDRETRSALAVPVSAPPGCLGMIYLDSPAAGTKYEQSHLDLLAVFSTLVGRQLLRVMQEQADQRQGVENVELAFVRQVQAKMDPAVTPEWATLQVGLYSKPGHQRSGDVFDIMQMPNGLAAFFVGFAEADLTRSALAMAEARTAFRMAGMHADPPHIFMRALNWVLRAGRDTCRLHGASVVMSPKNGACEFATAGDIGALIVGHTGQPRLLTAPTIAPLGSGDYHQQPRKERLAPKETLVLYSPGCRIMTDPRGDPLGDERLVTALCDGFGQPAATALEDLRSDLSGFFKEGRQPADITLMLVHRVGS